MSTPEHAHEAVRTFLGNARWFGGKGRDWRLAGLRRLGEVPAPRVEGLRVVIDLAEVAYAGGGGVVGVAGFVGGHDALAQPLRNRVEVGVEIADSEVADGFALANALAHLVADSDNFGAAHSSGQPGNLHGVGGGKKE